MTKPLVAITNDIPDAGIKLLKRKGFRVKISKKDTPFTKAELITFVKGADAILSLLFDEIDGSVVKGAGSQLKIVANYAVGYNNINVKEVRARGVRVSNTPGVLNNSVADMAWALIFAITRRVVEADSFTRKGLYKGWGPKKFLGAELNESTLGVVGMGRIGHEVAKRACGFGMKIVYYDALGRNTKAEKKIKMKYMSFTTLIKQSDIVTLHVPLLPSTRHLVNKRTLSLMKKSSYLINISRGPVVDEKALVNALKTDQIKGAALDVFENEPALTPGLKKLQNVVITPHIASATWNARCQMSEIAAKNIIAVFEKKKMPSEITT